MKRVLYSIVLVAMTMTAFAQNNDGLVKRFQTTPGWIQVPMNIVDSLGKIKCSDDLMVLESLIYDSTKEEPARHFDGAFLRVDSTAPPALVVIYGDSVPPIVPVPLGLPKREPIWKK